MSTGEKAGASVNLVISGNQGEEMSPKAYSDR
jgi:hypothetical protein